MPVVIPEDCGQATLVFVHNSYSRPANVVIGFRKDLTGSNNPTTTANGILGNWHTAMRARLDSEAFLQKVIVTLGTATDPLVGESTNPPSQGSLSASTLPPGQAALVHKQTGLGGRRNKGRMYLPWVLDDTQVDDLGNVSAAMIAVLQPALNAWQNLWVTDTDTSGIVLLHSDVSYLTTRPSPGVKVVTATPTSPPVPTNVVSLSLDTIVASQIRRQTRHV